MREFSDERVLLDRCASGDRGAYTALYKSYISGLLKYIYLFTKSHDLSEEIVQDAFVKIWDHRDGLKDVQLFEPYLFKTAKNLLLDHLRKEKIQQKYHSLTSPFSEESEDYADSEVIYGQCYQLAENAINMLPEKRKQIFELKMKEEFSLDEIAARLGISKSVVKKQLYAANSFVREYLRRHGEITANLLIFMYLILPIR
ncbi:RNA polymerase sigma factor [Dyadobacter arcticus]|uniref:RNA polymerase sigma-70 factor (ECF subfamily) n=1 Tax=Dyadobacter arcticus TaxID=1078754 RepID=A0ABX0UR62_9BACT|nr:RNA polymerase sigma-70 factor [Dyadobacter arcticus]NIJ54399.1 RNA polymerase sigma-70 factor (ECF subfamily) [Dyadobacter arcticus]